MNALEVRNLSVQSPSGEPLSAQLNFTVATQTITGLVTNNQAMTRALLGLLSGSEEPEEGECLLGRTPMRELDLMGRSRLGILLNEERAYEVMTIGQVEKFFNSCSERWQAEEYFRLTDAIGISRKCKLSNLSVEQRTQVALAVLVARAPDLLVMDDFFTVLGRECRQLLRVELKRYAARPGKAVLILTRRPEQLFGLVETLIFVGTSTSVTIDALECAPVGSVYVLNQGREPMLSLGPEAADFLFPAEMAAWTAEHGEEEAVAAASPATVRAPSFSPAGPAALPPPY